MIKDEKRLIELEELTATAHAWRERMQSQSVSPSDEQALEAWLAEDIRNEEAYDRAITIWAAYDELSADDIAPDLLKPGFRERFSNWRGLSHGPQVNWRFGGVLAAMCLALIVLAISFSIPSEISAPDDAPLQTLQFANTSGQAEAHKLPDGSTVTLGPESFIELRYSDRSRHIVLLGGAALFEVEGNPDRPFTVKTGDLTAIALGTRFDVRQSGDVSRVSVSEGRVEVSFPLLVGGEKSSLRTRETLDAGQQVAATDIDGLREIQPIRIDQVGAWVNSSLVYHGATLSELLADASRHYEGEIIVMEGIEEIADTTITASFDGSDVERMLELIALSFPIELDKSQPDTIILAPLDPR